MFLIKKPNSPTLFTFKRIPFKENNTPLEDTGNVLKLPIFIVRQLGNVQVSLGHELSSKNVGLTKNLNLSSIYYYF